MKLRALRRRACLALALGAIAAIASSAARSAPVDRRTGPPLTPSVEHRPGFVFHPPRPGPREEVRLRYRVVATQPRLNRRLLGPAGRFVQGVPAEPVDSFVWDGEGSTPVRGRLVLEIEPMRNTGFIRASWTDRNGEWTYTQTRFEHPDHHASGVRLGSSVNLLQFVLNEGTAQNVYLHGDSGCGLPVLPTVFSHLAAWGPADVTLDGEPFENPFEFPAPRWDGHVMVTEGVRRADGSVRTSTGEIYDPSRAAEGVVQTGDLEAHLTFHDDVFPNTENVPAPFSFFYHLVFEEVRIEIVQADAVD